MSYVNLTKNDCNYYILYMLFIYQNDLLGSADLRLTLICYTNMYVHVYPCMYVCMCVYMYVHI